VKSLFLAAAAAAVALAATERPAHADTNFDLAFQTGVAKRFFSNPDGAAGLSGSVGPVLMVQADVALVPLVRVGAYVSQEMQFDGEPSAPFITSAGARVKLTPPLAMDKLRFWVFAGFGFAGLAAPSYHQQLPYPGQGPQTGQAVLADSTIPAQTGSFFEVPFGLGLSYKLRAPWTLLGELSGHAAFDSGGPYFDPTGRAAYETGGNHTPAGITIGSESFALFVTAGVGLDL
jgi:hypothetical protein